MRDPEFIEDLTAGLLSSPVGTRTLGLRSIYSWSSRRPTLHRRRIECILAVIRRARQRNPILRRHLAISQQLRRSIRDGGGIGNVVASPHGQEHPGESLAFRDLCKECLGYFPLLRRQHRPHTEMEMHEEVVEGVDCIDALAVGGTPQPRTVEYRLVTGPVDEADVETRIILHVAVDSR